MDIGKMIVVAGLAIAAVGAVVWSLGRSGFRGLPGDVRYSGDHFRVYFPIVTCIVLSLLLTAASWLWQLMTRK